MRNVGRNYISIYTKVQKRGVGSHRNRFIRYSRQEIYIKSVTIATVHETSNCKAIQVSYSGTRGVLGCVC
jgi:hypothetical protein